jgi:hypothetical protein
LKESKTTIHRGAILHAVAKRSHLTIVKIAKDAGYDQSTFYVHKSKPDLPLEILYKYSKVLNHNFSFEIPEMADFLQSQGISQVVNDKLTYDQLEKERDKWRDRYYLLLEEHNRIITEKLKNQ